MRRRKHQRESPKRYWLLLPILGLLSIGQVIAANRLVALDSGLIKIRSSILSLEEENDLLRQKIASASALITLKERAEKAGFITKPRLMSLSREYPVALDIKR